MDHYDIIYFTQNNSISDQKHYADLKSKAKNALYLYVAQKKPDLFNHLNAILEYILRWKRKGYVSIYLASIDSLLFRFVIKQNPQALLYGFDDGLANITPRDTYDSPYRYKKAIIYGKALGLPSMPEVKLRLRLHYSIYPDFKNIVEPERVVYIQLFNDAEQCAARKSSHKVVFFIGQPFQEYLDDGQIRELKRWLATQHIDYYVMHPREREPLLNGLSILDSKGHLAEDAIFYIAGDARPLIISAYSTVLFNINSLNADKIYLSIGNSVAEHQRLKMINRTGATIINIP